MSAGPSCVGVAKVGVPGSPRRTAKRPRPDACFASLKPAGELCDQRKACTEDGENVGDENVNHVRRSGRERSSVERYVPAIVHGKRVNATKLRHPPRFHITPMN